ncbi:hypothetical protein SAMN05660297_01300 [Natronincola peptidivorans]|uniref:YiaAB two helix domain-containing protein n=1 Tax=Natronincola peptidivorans TaxID=426128 RepID=A0A1I0BJA2_9FIRM|nr:hypothetical protein [Natronincola peptidivorans]SET07073.1 hypothetical protein SAMN05660297_01300 [Natronincola peptidivorans]
MARKMLGFAAFVATGALFLGTAVAREGMGIGSIYILAVAVFFALGAMHHYNELKS